MQKTAILILILDIFTNGLLLPQSREMQSPQESQSNLDDAYRIPEISAAIKVDGVLDDEAWKEALELELTYEIDPGENVPAQIRTRCLVVTNNKYLYVAFRADDPNPAAIRAHYQDRDTAWDDDWVFFTIDPFSDMRRGFQFIANPLGVQMDSLLNEVSGKGSEVDTTWDAIWDSAGRITEYGYEVEMAVPLTSLRFPRQKGEQRWGFQALRHYPRKFSYFFRLTPWDRNRGCTLCENVTLVGFSSALPGRNLELTPAVVTHRTDKNSTFPQGILPAGKIKIEPGLSARWGITPNVSLNAAVNPDFSQVEADAAQLEINTRFALFYPEKRPFFLEGGDLFQTPANAVYSRTIVDPRWGLKLTGKENRSAFGIILAQDDLTYLLMPANQESRFALLEQPVLNTTLRYRRDLGRQSTIGFLLTDRRNSVYANSVLGVDGFFKLSRVDSTGFQLLYSRTSYPQDISGQYEQPEDPFGAWGLWLNYRHEARNWHWWAEYKDIGKQFRADSGFIPRVDVCTTILGIRRVIWGVSDSWFSRINLSLAGIHVQDQTGNLTDRFVEILAEINSILLSQFRLVLDVGEERFNGILFDQTSWIFHFGIRPGSNIALTVDGSVGDAIDYVGSRPAEIFQAVPGLMLYIGHHFQLQFEHNIEILEINEQRLYRANLSQLKLVYQFDVRTFVRAVVQYLDLHRNLGLYTGDPDPVERHLFFQLLFSYKINPQTLFYIGYSDNRLGLEGLDLKQKDRTFFLKLSYAWQM